MSISPFLSDFTKMGPCFMKIFLREEEPYFRVRKNKLWENYAHCPARIIKEEIFNFYSKFSDTFGEMRGHGKGAEDTDFSDVFHDSLPVMRALVLVKTEGGRPNGESGYLDLASFLGEKGSRASINLSHIFPEDPMGVSSCNSSQKSKGKVDDSGSRGRLDTKKKTNVFGKMNTMTKTFPIGRLISGMIKRYFYFLSRISTRNQRLKSCVTEGSSTETDEHWDLK